MGGGAGGTAMAMRLLIAFLCGSALLMIVFILGDSEFGETSGKAIGTAVALAFFSLTGIAGVNLASRRPEVAPFGIATAVLSIAAFLAVAAAIWVEDFYPSSNEWEVAGVIGVLAFAGGHGSLLIGSVRESDGNWVRLTRGATGLALGLLSLMAVVEIVRSGDEVNERVAGVVAVLYILGTLLVPLLKRSTEAAASRQEATSTAASQGILRLDHLVVGVSDSNRSNAFYRDVLGAEVVAMPGGGSGYRIGAQLLKAHAPGAQADPSPQEPVRPGSSELCLVWDGPIQAAIDHLQRVGVPLVAGPVSRAGAAGLGRSVYVRDPDGSLVELISYG